MRIHRAPRRTAGFTLIELMVTITIASILLSIAVPAYQNQVRKSRRVEARNALLDLATREERFYSVANTYTNDPASLGYSGFGSGFPVGNGYYYLAIPTITAANLTATPPVLAGYSITANYTGVQVNDTSCASFTVTQTGQQTSLNSGGAVSTSTCWN
jgi:type IV pilus assembly protein PilE